TASPRRRPAFSDSFPSAATGTARDPRHLGAEIGFLALLHTWGQTLMLHPHLHCVVPGGGISADGGRWIPCRKGFLLPVRVLSRVFRGRFLALLATARRRGELRFSGRCAGLAHPGGWRRLVSGIRSKAWVVYAKPPFGGPIQVLKYLARYTHRVAISNRRILSLKDGKVRFRWKDYAQGSRQRTMSLDAVEFVRRFLLHILPRGFVRIRSFGFLANRVKKEKLQRIRGLLVEEGPMPCRRQAGPEPGATPARDSTLCPQCESGRLLVMEEIPPDPGMAFPPEPEDSS
ncbi:MAG: transposase, partial [Planctomycetota bacterium]